MKCPLLLLTSSFSNPQHLLSACNVLSFIGSIDFLHYGCVEGWVVDDGTGVQFQVSKGEGLRLDESEIRLWHLN